ncbi:MAG: NYN domain-containing protein [Actinomycetaceae bacterium]|nr:NYN domain-containing protein [Actinomycetaceae bacterium]
MAIKTYLIVDGENIDATLGLSVLSRRPEPEERPRWDRVMDFAQEVWEQPVNGLFFLNATSGHLPMTFVQALLAMDYRPLPLSGSLTEKVVDIGIQRTLDAIAETGEGSVILASHDGDFGPQLEKLLAQGHKVAIICFKEFLNTHLRSLTEHGLEIIDLEHTVHAFTETLPRIKIINLEDFDPYTFI